MKLDVKLNVKKRISRLIKRHKAAARPRIRAILRLEGEYLGFMEPDKNEWLLYAPIDTIESVN